MSDADRELWDEKWAQIEGTPDVSDVLRRHRDRLKSGVALDIACGSGQNSVWLAANGYKVLGVDLSPVALRQAVVVARSSGLADKILFAQVDLDQWRPAPNSVDFLCVMRFLDRNLIPHLRRSVRPSGLVAYATRHVGVLERRPDANREYLLHHCELLELFAGWEVLEHLEGEENASLVARKRP